MKSLHKIILFALLPLMGACSGMLDIEPHSAVSPTVVGSDDIEALRIGMYKIRFRRDLPTTPTSRSTSSAVS